MRQINSPRLVCRHFCTPASKLIAKHIRLARSTRGQSILAGEVITNRGRAKFFLARTSLLHSKQALLEDALLRFGHGVGFGGVVVVPAGEVEEAVDEVEGDLVLE